MDHALVDAHLARAASSLVPYEAFDWAWKAFNVMYECEHVAGLANREGDLIARAVGRLAADAASILSDCDVGALVKMDAIFDDKVWARAQTKDQTRHNIVKKILKRIGDRQLTLDDLHALVDLLYVVRCNMAHGFKSPDGPRDVEVLSATAPIIVAIASQLRKVWF